MKLLFNNNNTFFNNNINYCEVNKLLDPSLNTTNNDTFSFIEVRFKNLDDELYKKKVKSFGIFPELTYTLPYNNYDRFYVKIKFNIFNNQDKKIKIYNGKKYIICSDNLYKGYITNFRKLRISLESIDNNTIIQYKSIDFQFLENIDNKNLIYSKNVSTKFIELDNIYYWQNVWMPELRNGKTDINLFNKISEKIFIDPEIYNVCEKIKDIKNIDKYENNSIYSINKYTNILNFNNVVLCNDLNFTLLIQSNTSTHYFININNHSLQGSPHMIQKQERRKNNYKTNLNILYKNFFNFSSVIEDPIYMFSVQKNYLHFTRDCLPYIYQYMWIKSYIPNIKIFIIPNKKHSPFIYDFLSALDIKKNDIYNYTIDDNRDINKTLFKKVFIGNFTDFKRDKLYISFIRDNIYDRIYNKYRLQNIKEKKRYYISRRIRKNMGNNIGQGQYKNRYIINEIEFVKLLKKYNFEEIWAEDYSVQEKIKLFENCKYLFFQYSAFFYNLPLIKNTNIHIFNCGIGADKDDPAIEHSIIFNNNKIKIHRNCYEETKRSNNWGYNNCSFQSCGNMKLDKVEKILKML